MENTETTSQLPRHLRITEPSPWVRRFAPLAAEGGTILDLACGGGRHTRHLLGLGFKVVAIDRDVSAISKLAADPNLQIIEADLEDGSPWPLDGDNEAGRAGAGTFAGVVVTNYLYRPLLPHLIASLAPKGVFIYETFARGNEKFSKPRNPDHLLKSGELLALVLDRLHVVAYEHGIEDKGTCPSENQQSVVQRIAAVNTLGAPMDEPEPVLLKPA